MTNSPIFNGVHLRTESDAQDWVDIAGGSKSYLHMYSDTMVKAGFASTPPLPLFIASGLIKSADKASKDKMRDHVHDIMSKQVRVSVFKTK